jgi:hypothetical protein
MTEIWTWAALWLGLALAATTRHIGFGARYGLQPFCEIETR